MSGLLTTKSDAHVEVALAAIAATPSIDDALKMLDEQGYKSTKTALEWFAKYHHERLAEVRQIVTPRLEQSLADGLLDNARLAQIAIGTAIQRTNELLEKGVVRDPDKVARNLSDVVAKSIDKKLALEGRPTQINESRTVTQILGDLERYGVVEDAEVVHDDH